MSDEVSHESCIDVHGHVSTEPPASYHVLQDSYTDADAATVIDTNTVTDR